MSLHYLDTSGLFSDTHRIVHGTWPSFPCVRIWTLLFQYIEHRTSRTIRYFPACTPQPLCRIFLPRPAPNTTVLLTPSRVVSALPPLLSLSLSLSLGDEVYVTCTSQPSHSLPSASLSSLFYFLSPRRWRRPGDGASPRRRQCNRLP